MGHLPLMSAVPLAQVVRLNAFSATLTPKYIQKSNRQPLFMVLYDTSHLMI